jgi:hypothetical protein
MGKTARFLLVFLTVFYLMARLALADQTYVIKAGRLIDGQSDQVRHDVIIIIQGNKIVALD